MPDPTPTSTPAPTPAPPAPAPAPTPEPPAPPTPPAAGDPPVDEPKLGDAGKAALAVERKRASDAEKELKSLREKVQGFEDASKTEAEKAAERLAAAEKAVAEAAGRLARYEVAFEKSIPAHLIDFVTGSTREEVEASATKVLAAFASSKPTGPQPDPSQGSQGVPVGIDEQIAAAVKAGDMREVFRLKARKSITS